MTLTLVLTEEQERLIRESADRLDEATVRQILGRAVDDVVERLLGSRRGSKVSDNWPQTEETLDEFFEGLVPAPRHLRSKEEIDAYLQAERDSWD